MLSIIKNFRFPSYFSAIAYFGVGLTASQTEAAVDIIFDYSYDTGGYFDDEKRYILDQVAYAFESRMGGTSFTSMDPNDYPGSTASDPKLTFTDPSTGTNSSVVPGSMTDEGNVIGSANELIIFMGARDITSLSTSGPFGWGTGGYFPPDAWVDAMLAKDTNTHYEPKGAAISVKSDQNFYFDTDLTTHTDATSSGKIDFYSLMVYSMGRALGFFTSTDAFANYSNGNTSWSGSNAVAEYSGQNIPLTSNGIWSTNIVLANINSATTPAMGSIGNNIRRGFTDLDFALLKDIGYSISDSPVGTNIGGTYTDPDLGGSYFIPVSMSYADWLAAGNGTGQSPNSSQQNHIAELNSTVDMEMIWVDPGTFTMGSPESEPARFDNETQHEVTLSQGLYIGKFEVTQAQYEAVMKGASGDANATPSAFHGNPSYPVESVSYNDIAVFLDRLNTQQSENIPTGWEYALPTEAEWEYACRAGTSSTYSWGSSITSSNANYNTTVGNPVTVGQYSANAWGLFDMHGNVFEWTADWSGSYDTGSVIDPTGPNSGSSRVARGGSWKHTSGNIRAARRNTFGPTKRFDYCGFRVVFKKVPHVVELNSTVDLEMIWVEPGTFTMGSPESEPARFDNETQHEVTLSQGLYIGKFEVTQAQYEAVMKGAPGDANATPSAFHGNPSYPVESVSYNDIAVFLDRLNTQQSENIPTGWEYALPTEAEWEYACRAGTSSTYSWGSSITSSNANYNTTVGNPVTVGQYSANAWGLFDMHGNVFEWTADWSGSYDTGSVIDPTGPNSGSSRVARGGSWKHTSGNIRAARRNTFGPTKRFDYCGFRVVFKKVPHVVELNSTVDLEMIWVEPGTFTMGSPESETGRGADETQHEVTLTNGFYLGKFEVTQAQYEAVMTGVLGDLNSTPSNWHGYPNRPVEKVSFNDVQVFLQRLNEQEAANLPVGWAYVLPTEAQWEFACRAGTSTSYSTGETISTGNANYSSSGYSQTQNTGQYSANPWGFFDMHGNVWELCSDWYSAYPSTPIQNPTGSVEGTMKISRGGSWYYGADITRSANRNSENLSGRSSQLGFRLAFQQVPNNPPADLNSTAELTISENQPIGSIVGEFNATDPEGGVITYHFVEGENNNSLFALDASGILKTATTFDYESNASSYIIKVQAKDDQNATIEDEFLVSLIDYNEGEIPTIGDGTTANPYQIATLGHLRWLSINPSVWDAEFLQIADINASDTKNWDGGVGFTPIGVWGNEFEGKYFGGGHSITHLYINQPESNYKGFFGYIWTGEVSDLSILDVNISGSSVVGGLAGSAHGLLSRCFASGEISGSGGQIGGLVGSNGGVIEECGAAVEVNGGSGSSNVGGLVGHMGLNDIVRNSYARGKVTGYNTTGGLVAYSIGGFVINSYSTGQIVSLGSSSSKYGLVKLGTASGSETVATATNSFWDKGTSGVTSSYDGGGIGKTTANMKVLATFNDASWDFNEIWFMPENDYPILRWQVSNFPPSELNSTAVLAIAENQPTGSIVGEFNATDPDGHGITYHFVNGDNNNSLFTLDTNGILKTATTFDYESNASSYTITVQARDEYNAFVEGNFTITLLDVYEPSKENHIAELNSTVDLEMIWVEPGTFMMGSPESEEGRIANRESPQHEVTLSNGFYLGKYEVTQAQYEAVMAGVTGDLNATPSNWHNNPNRAVELVSWDDIQKFLIRLNAQEAGNIPEGWAYVLPTEAQWEYACRAGTTTAYSWGDSITTSDANYNNTIAQTTNVGSYSANPWGFFDMHGNVREWTSDWYATYESGALTNPEGPATGSSRVSRGGSWNGTGTDLRSAYRGYYSPSFRAGSIGFRLSLQKVPHVVELNSTVNLEMIWVEPGTFTIGSPESETGRGTNETQHEVTLTTGFYLGKYEVTQAQYEAVMTGNSDGLSATPSNWPNNPNRPVEKVSWDDIQVFLTRLNAQETGNIPEGWAYVLPTEAQWEYACRAGTTTAYSWGDTISASDANWNHGNDANQTEDVSQYSANPWGFFDMHGNVWEWTADAWATYASGAQTDPFNAGATDSHRVLRGGSWFNTGSHLRSAHRGLNYPSARDYGIGFRVGFQLVPDTVSPELELFGGTDVPHELGVPWAEPGYAASDERDGNLTGSVTISGTPNINTSGTYTLTYTVADAAGNEANATRTVNVIDSGTDTDGDGFDDFIEAVAGSGYNDSSSTPFNYGLIAWYPFDGNASDMSGNGNDGTVYGASSVEDRSSHESQALDFNGSNNHVELPSNVSSSLTKDLTISMWVHSSEFGPGSQFLFLRPTSGNSESVKLGISPEGIIEFRINDDPLNADVGVTEGLWQHIVITFDGGMQKIYLDGPKVASRSKIASLDSTTEPSYIAVDKDSNLNQFFNGSIDDIRIYDRALSAEEIELLYRAESPNHFVDFAKDLEMIWVEPGTFTMGQTGVTNAEPEHNVTLTKGFYLGKYEVTQAQYEAVMDGNTVTDSNGNVISATPSQLGPDRPVERVSWDDIQVFLTRLNEQQADNLPVGWAYVLPTEAQWEYACRAGTTTAYSWGDTITSEDANYNQTIGQTTDVGQYSANPWGFFDMHGNVWEWTRDAYDSYVSGDQTDPFNPGVVDSVRVNRGGSWDVSGTGSANRNYGNPFYRNHSLGFRLGLQYSNQPPSELNSTTVLTISENQPIGTIVGEFNATDLQGYDLIYSLVEGNEDNNNSLFDLEENGSLTLKTDLLDYDLESNLTIRVRVTQALEGSSTKLVKKLRVVAGYLGTAEVDHKENQWRYIAVTKASNLDGKIYVDGKLAFEGSYSSHSYYYYKLHLGASEYTGFSGYFSGLLDEFRLSNSVRSAFEIEQNFLNNQPFETDESTIGHWHFDENSGTSVSNSKGGASGNLYNGPTFNPGKFGNSLKFDGLDDRANLNFDMPEASFSLEFWTKGENFTGTIIQPYGSYSSNISLGLVDVNETLPYKLGASLESDFIININQPPTDLNSTANLSIAENKPVGTIVGEFNATDPEGGAITYLFVVGENNNSLFTLDTNGTLKTATTFDYENNASSYTITVQAKDELNATTEGNFTVTLLDQAEIAYDPNTLDGTLYTISNSGVTDVFVQGPVGQDLNISYSPTIPSGLNVTFHSDQDLYILKPFSYAGEQTVTLSAGGSIFVQASITASHTNGKLTAHYGLSEPSVDNSHFFIVAQPINLEMGVNFFSQHGMGGEYKSYQIIHELNSSIQTQPNLDYALGRDINTSQVAGFSSIDKSNDFEGLGHKIGDNLGTNLFGSFSNGNIANLELRVQGDARAILANSITNARIVNVHLEGQISSIDRMEPASTPVYSNYMGAVAGVSTDSKLFFCSANVTITGSSYIGGFLGSATGSEIHHSYVLGSVIGTLTGYYWAHRDYANEYTHFKPSNVGGFIGSAIFSSVINSYTNCAVLDDEIGSEQFEEVTDWRYDPELEWYGGELGGEYDYDYLDTFRALLGYQDSDTNITNSFGNSSHLFYPTGDQSKTETELKTKSTYTDAGWDFEKIWHYAPNKMPIFKWKQRAPLNLKTSSDLTFSENSKVETVIGNFTAEDPDGHSITYHLVDGIGGDNNSLFNLHSDGTLKTAYVFDYESNASSYSIRVQARDEYNGTIEGNFTVQLEDMPDLVYDPSTLDSKLEEFRDEGKSDVLVVGPFGQDFNISYSPTIPSDLNVTFHSDQDLYISNPFSYAGEQTVTLSAAGSIFVQAPISASHSNGKFAAHYGLSEPSVGNQHFFIVAQPVNLEMGENFSLNRAMMGN